MVARCLNRGDKLKNNITLRNLTEKYFTCFEQHLSHISVFVSAPPPANTRPSVETVAVLAQKLPNVWLCTKSMGLCLH